MKRGFLLFLILSSSLFAKGEISSGVVVNELKESSEFSLLFEGQLLISYQLISKHSKPFDIQVKVNKIVGPRSQQSFHIIFTNSRQELMQFKAISIGSSDSIMAESNPKLNSHFPLVRNSDGPSINTRNHCLYERSRDLLVEADCDQVQSLYPAPATLLHPIEYEWKLEGIEIEFTLKPNFYRDHKGIKYFDPKHKLNQKRPVGWCSWYNSYEAISENEIHEMITLFHSLQLDEYGFDLIQIDDGYQKGVVSGNGRPPESYGGGRPSDWLEWNAKFPTGIKGYVSSVNEVGFNAGIWVGCFCNSDEVAQNDPDALVHEPGKLPVGASWWLKYGWNTLDKQVCEHYITPTYQGIREAGFTYVKIDFLRHYLYDCLNNLPDFTKKEAVSSQLIMRNYLNTARRALGDDVFILSCWGVLPESVGIVDACRISGDGFGPASLQQYNSWNGLVWINDPDTLLYDPHQIKRVKTGRGRATPDSVLQPLLVSISGSMMLLGGNPKTYEDPIQVEGLKRAIPVLPTQPGQLYDFDPSKSDLIPYSDRTGINKGAEYVSIDADQEGKISQWWMMEVDRDFGHWYILSRMNWTAFLLGKESVQFSDLGLPKNDHYLVYEFWSQQLVKSDSNSFSAKILCSKESAVYMIKAATNEPQLLSTNRHISQGGVEVSNVKWDANLLELRGESEVIKGDFYQMVFHLPRKFDMKAVMIDGEEVGFSQKGELVRVSLLPSQSKSILWSLEVNTL